MIKRVHREPVGLLHCFQATCLRQTGYRSSWFLACEAVKENEGL